METSTDLDLWLDTAAPEEYEELYDLYQSVANRQSGGYFEATTEGEKTFISQIRPIDESITLVLENEEARMVFLAKVDARREDTSLSFEGWYQHYRAMQKND